MHTDPGHSGGRYKAPNWSFDTDAPAISDAPKRISDTDVVFGNAHIIPDVCTHVSEKVNLIIKFGDKQLENGTNLKPSMVAGEPEVQLKDASGHIAKDRDVFSLVLVDLDMPSPHNPKYKDTLYWMVNNIKGISFEDGDFTVEYMPPEPGKGTHRYVFLLYQQPSFQRFDPPSKRVGFQTKQWAKDHGLGDPVAAVYFRMNHNE